MPDIKEEKRRATDVESPDVGHHTCDDAWHRAGLAHKRINDLDNDFAALRRAFLKDDLGTPDYEGHRADHRERKDAATVVKAYKYDATKGVISYIIGGFVALVLAGLLTWVKAKT